VHLPEQFPGTGPVTFPARGTAAVIQPPVLGVVPPDGSLGVSWDKFLLNELIQLVQEDYQKLSSTGFRGSPSNC
jgi:hypothetical protein